MLQDPVPCELVEWLRGVCYLPRKCFIVSYQSTCVLLVQRLKSVGEGGMT